MSEQKDTKSGSSSSKALLYSEILNISATDHVHQLLQKKRKSFTHQVQRSPVLDRVSRLLQSIDNAGEEEVKNIEEVEEGEPVIDMSVTLIGRCEDDSDIDAENEDLEENGVKDKIILCSDSENEQSENESLTDESVDISCDSDSELPEIEKYKWEDICASSSDSDDEESESSDSGNELSESERKEVALEDKRLNILPESNSEIPEKESEVNVEGKNYLEPSKSPFGLLVSDLTVPKRQRHKHSLGLYEESKKQLISVIEDDDENLSPCKKQKRV